MYNLQEFSLTLFGLQINPILIVSFNSDNNIEHFEDSQNGVYPKRELSPFKGVGQYQSMD